MCLGYLWVWTTPSCVTYWQQGLATDLKKRDYLWSGQGHRRNERDRFGVRSPNITPRPTPRLPGVKVEPLSVAATRWLKLLCSKAFSHKTALFVPITSF